MIFQPLVVWWLIVPIALLAIAAVGWQIFQVWDKSKKVLFPWVRRGVLLLLLVIMALGPSVPAGTTSPGIANLDVLFVVDTTSSMGAQDYVDGQVRLVGVKKDLLALAGELKGAHLAVITFNSKADLVLPFTADNATFTAAIQAMTQEIYGTSKGSTIDQPVELMTKQLKNSKVAHPDRSRLVFYLGDGEQTSDEKVGSFADAAKYVDGGGVLGYGTSQGAKMLRYSGLGATTSANTTYVNTLDPTTKKFVPAVSKLDETALKKIASELKVTYQNRNKAGPLGSLLKDSKAELLIDRGRKITHYLNLYWLFAIPLTALLIWEWNKLVLLLIELRKNEKGHHA